MRLDMPCTAHGSHVRDTSTWPESLFHRSSCIRQDCPAQHKQDPSEKFGAPLCLRP